MATTLTLIPITLSIFAELYFIPTFNALIRQSLMYECIRFFIVYSCIPLLNRVRFMPDK